MDQTETKKILESGLLAPSADNGQPWQIKLTGRGFDLFLTVPKDHSEYYLALMGVGAFLKNVDLAAQAAGFAADVSFFPDLEQGSPIAKISFTPQAAVKSELVAAIPQRRTNRKPYQNYALSEAETAELMKAANDGTEIKLTADPEKIQVLSEAASRHQYLVLSNETLHKNLFSKVIWSAAEVKAGRYGMDIKTFELNPPQKFIFSQARSWFSVSLMNLLGFARVVQKDNARVFAQSSGMGILVSHAPLTAHNFIHAGQVLQELWLRATLLGLSIQPLGGITYMFQQPDLFPDHDELTPAQRTMVQAAYEQIKLAFGLVDRQRAVMMFRYGKAEEPSGHSAKKSLQEVLI